MRAMGMNPTENELLELINEVILPICINKMNIEVQVDRHTERQTHRKTDRQIDRCLFEVADSDPVFKIRLDSDPVFKIWFPKVNF